MLGLGLVWCLDLPRGPLSRATVGGLNQHRLTALLHLVILRPSRSRSSSQEATGHRCFASTATMLRSTLFPEPFAGNPQLLVDEARRLVKQRLARRCQVQALRREILSAIGASISAQHLGLHLERSRGVGRLHPR